MEAEIDPFKAIFLEIKSDFGANILHPRLFTVKCISDPEPVLRFYFEGELDGEPEIKGLRTIKELHWFALEEILELDLAFKSIDLEVIAQFRDSSK